jgi:hypothetical protein
VPEGVVSRARVTWCEPGPPGDRPAVLDRRRHFGAVLERQVGGGHAATDYHPRTRRIWPPVAIGSLATAAGALAAVLSLAGGAGSAFAGWTPRPTAPTRAQLAAAEAYCAENVPFPGLPLKLTDTRGPFTFAVYSDGSSNDFCTTGPSFRNASGRRTSPPLTAPAGKLFLWDEHTTTDSGQAYTFLSARAGDAADRGTRERAQRARATLPAGRSRAGS